jgi:hypothetical protein
MSAAELECLRSLLNAQAAELTEAQIDALAAVGNRAVNDAVHADLCMCGAWPKACLSSGGFFQGYWDVGALDTAVPAVVGLWEAIRRPSEVAEVAPLRAENELLRMERNIERIWYCHKARMERRERARADRLFAEARGLRARVAELEATAPAELTVYRASHESIVMGLYTTREAAQHHCEAAACRDIYGTASLFWIEDEEDGVFELVAEMVRDARGSTGYVVTPLAVASAYDPEVDE